MDYFIIFVLGFVTGWIVLRMLVTHRVNQLKKVLTQVIEKKLPEEVGVVFSRHGDSVHVHDAITSEFLAQGNTREEIVEVLESRFPNKVFKATSDNIREVGFK